MPEIPAVAAPSIPAREILVRACVTSFAQQHGGGGKSEHAVIREGGTSRKKWKIYRTLVIKLVDRANNIANKRSNHPVPLSLTFPAAFRLQFRVKFRKERMAVFGYGFASRGEKLVFYFAQFEQILVIRAVWLAWFCFALA